ncbi:sensor domain-containing diguanylate cyclase [Buttiauxella sp.]|uniref:sensor domain-containing diguanylate cyclase n=1 Tax=Buttiauxella sp. TaxID=1972222 RepID=UPI003C706F3A
MQASKKLFTVNHILTLFFLVMLIPFIMVSVWTFDYTRKDNIEVFENSLSRFTHNTAMESVNRQLEEIEMVFKILNSRITHKGMQGYIDNEHDVLHSIFASMVNTLTFFDAAIISDNQNQYRIYPDMKFDNYFPSKRPWYPGIKQQNGVHYSEPYQDLLPDPQKKTDRAITVSMDLFDEELLKYGNIAFDLDLYAMSAPLRNIVTPFEGRFLVAARDGSIIMHSNDKKIFHRSVPIKWLEKAIDIEGSFYDEASEKFIFYHSFSEPYWVAFTVVDKAMYDEFISKAPQTLICIVAICLIIYIILICLCRVYIKGIISRLYMSMHGISYEGESQDLERVYNSIKQSHVELKEARRISGEDALTGIGTRRRFDDKLNELIQNNILFHLAIVDLDNFKKINDTFGHAVGDSVLKYVSNVGKSVLEPDYDVYRFGGEELVVIFPGDDFETCFNLMDTWRVAVGQRVWRETPLKVSFSCGIARWNKGETAQDIIIKADKALYEAKHAGKNTICRACE